jgi:phage tail-like protein
MLIGMPLPDQDSAVGHSFVLELDGVDIRLLEVQNLVLSIFGLETGGDTTARAAARAVTLVRPLARDSTFADWAHQTKTQGVAAGRSATIVVFAIDGSPVARYHLENAWPSRLDVGSLRRGDDTVVVERLTVTYDDVEAG